MKRFLSILLASLLVLGTMSFTVNADVEFGLNLGTGREALANYPFAMAGRKVMFDIPTLADGQTVKYFNGEIEVTAESGLIEGTVSLPIEAGENRFTAKIYNGEELVSTSSAVNVYGVSKYEDNLIYGYGATDEDDAEYETLYNTTDVTETFQGYLTDDDETNDELATAVLDGGRTKILKPQADALVAGITLYYDMEYTEQTQDIFWDGTTPEKTVRIFSTYGSSSARNAFGVAADGEFFQKEGGGGSTAPSDSERLGVYMPQNEWVNFKFDHYYETGAADVYVDDVLLVKSLHHKDGATFTKAVLRNFCLENEGWYLNRRTIYGYPTMVSNPKVLIEASVETVGGVVVTGQNIPEDATVYLYKNGVKAQAVDFAGEETVTVALTGTGEESVYAQAEYADGSLAFGLSGDIKTDELLVSFADANPFTEAAVATVNSGGVGVVTFDDTLLEEDEVSIIVVKNDGTIERKVYTKGVDQTTQTFTNVEKLFVWKWGTMVPLCYAATID